MARRRSTEPPQALLGLVAPDRPTGLSPSRRELLRRAGTILSPGQQIAARRRAVRQENRVDAELETAIDEQMPADVQALMRNVLRPLS